MAFGEDTLSQLLLSLLAWAVVIVLYLITKWRGGSVGPAEEPEPTQSRYGGQTPAVSRIFDRGVVGGSVTDHGERRVRRTVPDARYRPVRGHRGPAARACGSAWSPPRRRSRCRPSWPATWPGTGAWTTRWTRGRSPTRWPGCRGSWGRSSGWSGALEQLQVPLAQARDALGIPGMDAATAHNVRDKSRMKEVLTAAGVPCARHQLVRAPDEALAFAAAVGFPLVAKPPAGAGAQATYRLDDADALRSWLARHPAAPGGARPAGGVPRRRRAHVRQRADRRAARCGRRSRTTGRRRSRCCATRGSSGRCCSPASSSDPRYAGDPRRRAGRRAGPRRARRPHAHGVVPPPRRLGRGVRGRRPAARRADRHDARVRARRRLLPDVVRAGDPRPVRAAGAEVRGRLRVPARAGPGPRAGRARRRGAAAPARAPGRGGEAARARPARVVELRGRGLGDRARPGHRGGRRRAGGDRRTASAWSWWRRSDQRGDALAGLPGRDAVLHAGAGRASAPG